MDRASWIARASAASLALAFPYAARAQGGAEKMVVSQQNADALRRFNRVLYESATYVNAHHAETAPIVAEITKIDMGVIEKMNRTLAGTSLDVTLMQPLIDAAAKYGLIARAFPARELLIG